MNVSEDEEVSFHLNSFHSQFSLSSFFLNIARVYWRTGISQGAQQIMDGFIIDGISDLVAAALTALLLSVESVNVGASLLS